jgi:hypothetical protein
MMSIELPLPAIRAGVAAAALLLAAPLLHAVDFATQVHPILVTRCLPCHSGEKPPAGLSFADRASVLKGGVHGPAITPGDDKASLVMLRITHQKGALMPPVGEPLTSEQIATLAAWIDEGAVWPESTPAAATRWVSPIAPRLPGIPDGPEPNPIDRFINDYLRRHNLPPAQPVSDAVFARRVYFDLWGWPPTPDQLRQFVEDSNPNKRQHLVDTLLADRPVYAGNWISWWNDLLRNDTGVNYQGDRKSITSWLLRALESNLSYKTMVSQLVNPVQKDDPDGFLIGVNWRGTVNASQTPYMQASQNTAQIFLGINLKCASCHDSFVNKYKLRESYGMAALFAPESKLELVRCDVKQGKYVTPQLLYPELGAVPEGASLADRHAAAAAFFTDERNGRVPRTIVNRYWQKLFGRGLVEPVDDMDSEPWDADLLDWLASDFAAHGSDLQYLLRLLMTSTAYQLPAQISPERPERSYIFRGPLVRRLTAEQFADSISVTTGQWRTIPQGNDAIRVRDWELKISSLTSALGRPVRDQVFTTRDNRATTFQALDLVNGELLTNLLRRGSLRLVGELPPAPVNLFDSGPMNKGTTTFDVDISKAKELWLLTQDAGSYDPSRTVAGWFDVELTGPNGTSKLKDLTTLSHFGEDSLRAGGADLGKGVVTPLGAQLFYPIQSLGFTRMRGRVVIDDRSRPSDIGGSVRFFVFDAKPDPERLVKIVGVPPAPFPVPVKTVDEAIHRLYLQLLGREPITKEVEVARGFFISDASQPPKLEPSALQDFLWSLFMHPDFQYLY